MVEDRFWLKKQLQKINSENDSLKKQQYSDSFETRFQNSQSKLQIRNSTALNIDYPDLPVSHKREEILKLIRNNQVVIIASDTGSGKTTQIPKMCLELGLGRAGMIAHTQPRRLAAKSVAQRICNELNTSLGDVVGYKVRFSDQVSDTTLIKLLTDGMLLAELQTDRFLSRYDTIIIDEAHERSLNIDFILGYLKRILPKRPDLKVIITSATIDPDRFANFFNQAPVIEISGLTFPVELRYRDYIDDELEIDQSQAIANAIEELSKEAHGDILVFLSSEREIRETQTFLKRQQYRATEIIPLYARLSGSEQQKIFQPGGLRRIILSTNVAETSLTVPGIKYVIDTGYVRMSRYSHRTKVQRLPIEPISQASAKQRAGRCGRTSPGICIRLYSEQDFLSRPLFTDPEIIRTHLSSVILKMLSLRLGDINQFEFMQPPEEKFFKDGIRLLQELEAVTSKRGRLVLTKLGSQMARLALDAKYSRMIMEAGKYNCVQEIMIITAGLSIQDPRERPHDKQQKADEAQSVFKDKQSDLMSLLNLYLQFKTEQKNLTQNQLRKWCKSHFINFQRMREWQDIVHQTKQNLHSVGLSLNSQEASYENIHRALLSGLLTQIGLADTEGFYLGARNSKFKLFPGSALFSRRPKWIMCAELVETSQLYARQSAIIDVQWLEHSAKHLVKFNYCEPHWSKSRACVMAYLNISLFGLPIVNRRLCDYSKVDPVESKTLFIRHALVQFDTKLKFDFLQKNRDLVEQVDVLESKIRRRDILIDEEYLVDFYNNKLPDNVVNEATFKKWWRSKYKEQSDYLDFDLDSLLQKDVSDINQESFPDVWQQNHLVIPLSYQFEPNQNFDGVCLNIPLNQLNQIENKGFDWLVRGMRLELLIALIKSLPKKLRKNFVPAPDFAQACLNDLNNLEDKTNTALVDALASKLFKMTGVRCEKVDFDNNALPTHLRFNFAVLDGNGKTLGIDKSLHVLKQKFTDKLSHSIKTELKNDFDKKDIKAFEFESLPTEFTQKQNGFDIKIFPGLELVRSTVNLRVFTSKIEAQKQHEKAIVFLLKSKVPSPIKYLQNKLPNKAKLSLYFNPFGKIDRLIDDLVNAAIENILLNKISTLNVRTQEQFNQAYDLVRENLNEEALIIAQAIEGGLAIANKIQKSCKGNINLNMFNNIASIKQHLDELVCENFISKVGVNNLKDWNRYLKALQIRTEKLKVDINRDRINQIEVDKAKGSIEELYKKCKDDGHSSTWMAELREMLEELRVSLFAQQLGTKYPISYKRIANKLNSVEG